MALGVESGAASLNSRTTSLYADPLTPDTAGEDVNPLHYAAAMGDKKALVAALASGDPGLINQRDAYGRTALVYAVVSDNYSCADLLIQRGVDVNSSDKEGRAPFHWAAFHGRIKMLKLLLNNGADPLALDAEGRGGLHLSVHNKSTKCFQLIFKSQGTSAHTNRQDQWGLSPLHWSCFYNSADHLKLLLKAGADLLVIDGDGKTPFHWAASAEGADALKILMGAWPSLRERVSNFDEIEIANWPDAEGRTLLHMAVAGGSEKTFAYVMTLKPNLRAQDASGRSALHWAAQLGHTSIAQKLLQQEPILTEMPDAFGLLPIHYAAQEGSAGVITRIINANPQMQDLPDSYGRTALILAAANGSSDCVGQILSIQSDPRHQDSSGNTALHMAAFHGHHDVFPLLLAAGSPVDQPDSTGATPLLRACEGGHGRAVVLLVDAGADVNLLDEEKRTYLHWAAVGGHANICRFLVAEANLATNARDQGGRTPLATAAFQGHEETIIELIALGAEADVQDDMGITALHWASNRGSLPCVKALIEMGHAFPNHTEFHEERLTPLDYALLSGHEHVASYLREQGGLTIQEVQSLAATHIKAWWKGFRARITLVSLWQQHLLRSGAMAGDSMNLPSLKPRLQNSKRRQKAKAPAPKQDAPAPTTRKQSTSPEKPEKKQRAQAPQTSLLEQKLNKASVAAHKSKLLAEQQHQLAEKQLREAEKQKVTKLPAISSPQPRTRAPAPKRSDDPILLPPVVDPTPALAPSPPAPRPSVQHTVRKERRRVGDIRAVQRAAVTIQRAVRRWLALRQEVREGKRPPMVQPARFVPPHSKQAQAPPKAKRVDEKKRKAISSSRTNLFPPSKPRLREQLIGDPSNKQHQIAALTIQLAWRQALQRIRASQRAPRIRLLHHWSSEVRAVMRREQQQQVYLDQPRIIPQWKPKLARVDRPNYLRTLPSPAVTSFNFAIDTYYSPILQGKGGRASVQPSNNTAMPRGGSQVRNELQWMREMEQRFQDTMSRLDLDRYKDLV
eukprot:m.38845 g.38845  ORF g.38845 m.38845 type:complete len:1018 (+) comp5910_c0_seq1:136-3189(+)